LIIVKLLALFLSCRKSLSTSFRLWY